MQGSFIVYLIGYILMIAGVAYGMIQADVPQTWVTVVVLVLAGAGLIYAFSRSQRDKAMDPEKNAQADRMRQQGGGAAGSGQAQGGGAQQGGQEQPGGGQAQGGGQQQPGGQT
jgi:hypothetical protein